MVGRMVARFSELGILSLDEAKAVAQTRMAELVDTACLAQYSAPVCVVEEVGDGPWQLAGGGEPDPGHQ